MVQETLDPERDGARLDQQRKKVWLSFNDDKWHTLYELSEKTGAPAQSVSARIRDFRKSRYGSHQVDRRYVAAGVWEYKLFQNKV